MNLYAYCGNNPLNWIDPWGLDKEKAYQEARAKVAEAYLRYQIIKRVYERARKDYTPYRDLLLPPSIEAIASYLLKRGSGLGFASLFYTGYSNVLKLSTLDELNQLRRKALIEWWDAKIEMKEARRERNEARENRRNKEIEELIEIALPDEFN